MISLKVNLGERSYPICIGENLLDQGELLTQHIPGNSALIVSDETVAPLYMDKVENALSNFRHKTLVLPDGEEHKNLNVLNTIYDSLLENKLDRNTTLIALGGGVIGDITGFAAATYQRGVHLIQIPTTLLSQVDSSVGGKTAVNHPLGKNMIGAFYQPKAVIADTSTLDTLEQRQLCSGIAEVIKYGLIRDTAFLEWLESNIDKLLDRDPEALAYAIERSCRNKAEVVAADERESGQRALLNLGHTFGHAIETGMGYGAWLHGEAVASGMVMAARLSNKLGWITESDVDRVINIIERANLPVKAPEQMSSDKFVDLMSLDKKVSDGVLNLVLYKSLGKAVISKDYTDAILRETISESY
ncbi:MAG: 3-dehydroquinate synthase [endosymbiont of Galathealinum brachiosum]|uniref:3-dehydroquinate synthase n=1 Tax=endosymbiont of Galathealinum brachiosum TaxID=2200906 RepID=A0A370D9U0_9GAMM|nr:MAG: 3-dehydroquinate synthase [endosymbiont of Galathealinum brachiosum]